MADDLHGSWDVNREIQQLFTKMGLTPILLGTHAKQITWAGRWVGYDDNDTLTQKVQAVNSLCIGGTMIWSIDFDSGPGSGDESDHDWGTNTTSASTGGGNDPGSGSGGNSGAGSSESETESALHMSMDLYGQIQNRLLPTSRRAY